MGEDFDPWVQPVTQSFAGVGADFYFNPQVTRTRPKIWFIHYFVQ
jgi:hypothetical protein